jgi:hypothetical protein
MPKNEPAQREEIKPEQPTQPEAPRKGSSPADELRNLEARRAELKAGAKPEDGEWARVKTRIAELNKQLGIA